MGRWSVALAPAFLRFACRHEPSVMLDIGCGTGSLLRAAARSFPDARLIGLDPAPTYLVHARAAGLPGRAELVAGLVEQMPFADGAFEACLSLLVLQEIRDRGLALREMARVTSAGGTVAACQWDFERGMPLSRAIREALRAVVPDAHERLGGPEAKAFASEAELRERWEEAGFADVETTRLVVTLSYASFDDLWQPLVSGSTPVTAIVAGLPLDARDDVRRRLRERLPGTNRGGSFSLRSEAFAVRGRCVRQTSDR